jgi:hypothetical protein
VANQLTDWAADDELAGFFRGNVPAHIKEAILIAVSSSPIAAAAFSGAELELFADEGIRRLTLCGTSLNDSALIRLLPQRASAHRSVSSALVHGSALRSPRIRTMAGERERLAPDGSVVDDWEQLAVSEGLAAAISPLCFANLMEISLAGSRRISSALIDALGSSMPGALQSCALPVSQRRHALSCR